MTETIPERLRRVGTAMGDVAGPFGLLMEAADEIDRLEAERDAAREDARRAWEGLEAERSAAKYFPLVARFKPLEWTKHPTAEMWRCDTILGLYQVSAIVKPASWTFDGPPGCNCKWPR